MLKRPITYEDFDGNKITEIFYFNLSKADLIRMEVSYKEGLQEALTKIVESKDKELILSEFEKLILASYGVKSEDGKRFERSPEITNGFRQSAAYDELIFEMFSDANAAAIFVKGIIPQEALNKMADQDKPTGPPPTPPTPPLPPGSPAL